MNKLNNTCIQPAPTDDEAAAIAVALTAYLTEQRTAQPSAWSPQRRWAMAARLTSQGQSVPRLRGARVGWGNVARLR